MVEILLVTHGPLGQALLETAKLILRGSLRVKVFGLYHGDNIEELQEKIHAAILDTEAEDGVLVLTDLFGGSPCNQTALVMKSLEGLARVECLAGVNLPLLIEALSMQESMTLQEIACHCRARGRDGIVSLREELAF